jgi:hypothetical protein
MARIAKNEQKWHRFTIKGSGPEPEELVLMGHGRGLQISVWGNKRHGPGFAYFCGEKTLKALAREILRPKKSAKGKKD